MNRPFSDTEHWTGKSFGLFLSAIKAELSIDLSPYAELSLSRRIKRFSERVYANTPEELLAFLKTNPLLIEHFLKELPVRVTEMFRDPNFWYDLKYLIIPNLNDSGLRIWCAGCSTGEEAWSLAYLLLAQNGLGKGSSFWATDIHLPSIEVAKLGLLAENKFKIALENMEQIPLGHTLKSDSKVLHNGMVQLPTEVISKIKFQVQDIVDSEPHSKFDLIVCRNLLIYFKKEVQGAILNRFYNLLEPGGFLCLGTRESLIYSRVADGFEVISKENKIFRKR